MKKNKELSRWKSPAAARKYRVALIDQIRAAGNVDSSHMRIAIQQFQKDPKAFLKRHGSLGFYIRKNGAERV